MRCSLFREAKLRLSITLSIAIQLIETRLSMPKHLLNHLHHLFFNLLFFSTSLSGSKSIGASSRSNGSASVTAQALCYFLIRLSLVVGQMLIRSTQCSSISSSSPTLCPKNLSSCCGLPKSQIDLRHTHNREINIKFWKLSIRFIVTDSYK